MDLIIERFGLAGLVIFGLASYILILTRRNNEIQDARIADAERHNERLLKITNEVKDATREVGGALDTLTEVVKDRGRHG